MTNVSNVSPAEQIIELLSPLVLGTQTTFTQSATGEQKLAMAERLISLYELTNPEQTVQVKFDVHIVPKIRQPTKKVTIPSKTRSGVEHYLFINGQGNPFHCTCEAFRFNPEKPCKHMAEFV